MGLLELRWIQHITVQDQLCFIVGQTTDRVPATILDHLSLSGVLHHSVSVLYSVDMEID